MQDLRIKLGEVFEATMGWLLSEVFNQDTRRKKNGGRDRAGRVRRGVCPGHGGSGCLDVVPVGNSTRVDFRTGAKYYPHPMDSIEIVNIKLSTIYT